MKKNVWVSILLLLGSQFFSARIFANNASYIATSGAISKQKHLEVVSNNAANVNTVGYQQDNVVFEKRDHKENRKKTDSFVVTKGNYRTDNPGPLRPTGRTLDMAIVGDAYFMILTPNGPKYTLDGAASINNANTLVNHNGLPYASKDGQPILFPETYRTMQIEDDGTIFADNEEVAIIGMFGFDSSVEFAKAGDNMYITNGTPAPIDDGTIKLASGYLRGANVNSTKVLTDVIEIQRSSDASNELVRNIGLLEKSMITRIMK